ncbi:hypothetical protein [Paractinoplanes maris]|uniref:hypothetical protein n=1 Tax=Paractinoplanes maris TaxID=1734446 RepID=UPI00202147AA|nr:hypothetical protein [Actinoplanes maris]
MVAPRPTPAVLRGLARNPAAPVELLLELLTTAPDVLRRALRHRAHVPRPVQEAIIAAGPVDNSGASDGGPYRRLVLALAEHRAVDRDLRYRLLADPDWRMRLRLAAHLPLTDEDLTGLLTDAAGAGPGSLLTRGEILDELHEVTRYDPRLYALAAIHPDPRIRIFAVRVTEHLPRLLTDPVAEIRLTAERALAEDRRIMEPADLPPHHCHAYWSVLQRPLSRALIDRVLSDDQALFFVGPNPTTPPDVVEALLRHPSAEVRQRLTGRADLTGDQLLRLAADADAGVRRAVSHHPGLTEDLLLRLAADADAGVRTAVSVHPGLTEDRRAAIDIDVPAPDQELVATGRRSTRYGDDPPPSLDDARRWSQSVNPLLRRRAARNGDLPVPLVDDPDPGVRLLTALHHPAAPPELLLRCFRERTGRGRELLGTHPRFPAEGRALFAGDEDPAVRRLVADDPQAGPEVVERLLGDPSRVVREAMASSPRLPEARILALLDDPDLAEHAAANPALPIARIFQP